MTATDERVRDLVSLRAGEWFIANRAGPLDPTQQQAFIDWLRASPAHIDEYLGIAEIASDLAEATAGLATPPEVLIEEARTDASGAVTAMTPAAEAERRFTPPAFGRVRRWVPRLAVAAAAAGIAIAVVSSRVGTDAQVAPPVTCATDVGQRSDWRLADGTRLHLDGDSLAVVRYSRAERIIEVGRGRAYFEVVHEPSRPFRAIAAGINVTDIGTRFVVDRRNAQSTVVTVVDGIVGVSLAPPAPAAPAAAMPVKALRVGAGQQVIVNALAVPDHADPADTREALAWLYDKIAFSKRPLGEVVAEFNRYSRTPIEIEDAALRTVLVSGVFDNTDTESFVQFLATLDGVAVERSTQRIRIVRRSPVPVNREPDHR